MQQKEWTQIRHNYHLDIGLLHAYYIQHAYPRHSHDYYVISLIEHGRQSFTHKGTKYLTPAGGIILINPGEVHTGEAADEHGFELRSIYPTTALMNTAVHELIGRHHPMPVFKDVRVDHAWATQSILALHKSLSGETDALETESRLIWTLAELIKRYANVPYIDSQLGEEKLPVQRARIYIEEHFREGISLNELAQHVALSPYYLLRVFRSEVGMPPYAYLESVRIGYAQRLIDSGMSLADVAVEAGFSSQSHMTNRFKRILGATPGQYAGQVRS